MAVNVLTAVFSGSRSRGSARLVLLALADVAADTGEVTAYKRSQAILAAKANIDPKTVPKAIDAVLKLGELVIIDPDDGTELTTRAGSGQGRRSTDYRIRLEVLAPAIYGVRETPPLTPPDAGSAPAADGSQTPPDAGSIIPSLPVDAPSPPVSPPRTAAARKQLLPDDFTVTLDLRAWAKDQQLSIDVDRETEVFCDHWRSKAEKRADWPATWRNWMRRADEMAATRPAPRRGRPSPPVPLSKHRPADDQQGGRLDL